MKKKFSCKLDVNLKLKKKTQTEYLLRYIIIRENVFELT